MGDTYSQDAVGPFTQKVGRYSVEERKEKIDRYRVKRQQRNFQKKITVMILLTTQPTNVFHAVAKLCPLLYLLLIISGFLQYACRKTLADSRPRVQGRFARNVEMEAEAVEQEASGNSNEHCNYSNFTNNSCNSNDSLCRESGNSTTFDAGKWWWETPIEAAAANGHHGHQHYQQQQQLLGFNVDDDNEEDLWACLADMCSGT